MDSTNFHPDHPYLQHQQQPQQQQQQPPYPYITPYSSLLDVHNSNINLLSTNQGNYSACVNREDVPSASCGVTNSDASSFSYHSLSSSNNNNNNNDDDDVMGSPNFLSNFLGIINNQNPSDGNHHPWIQQTRSINSNNSFSGPAANVHVQLGLTSPPPSSSSCFLGLNLQASDFFNSSPSCLGRQFSGFGDRQHHALPSPLQKLASGGLSWPSRSRALESTMASAGLVNNGVAGTKRPAGGNCSDASSKASFGPVSNKKSSLKNSCPPFKVRKEKLGDRIAALHQLVSPFGKTDTASVLTEAIGYIQFLQDQIHTLCMPNVKPLRNKPCNRIMQPMISSEDHQREMKEGGGQDLRKRGLCLVPLSWSSFITSDQLDASISLPPHHYF